MADASDDRRIGTVVAGYRIDAPIGRGGMGVVYRATHLSLGRQAALKLIAPDHAASSGFRERFAREARIAAELAHPNIVTVYDAGEVDGTLYLAMQYIEGSDLARMLAAEGRLKPYRAIDVCRQLGEALDAAHERGLVHRDVKPANVLISGRHAYLTDFGLTKRVGGTQVTLVGDVVGTIHYVAPEQIEGREVTGRSDVYSLGCVLYHCLTGRMPYERDTDVAVIYAHLSEPPPKPSRVFGELPAALDDVIARALDKSPERRFETCADLMAAARAAVDAGGPLAETSPPRPSAGLRRSRVLLAGVDASTRAIAHVALGGRVEVRESAGAGALDAARSARPDVVIAGAADVMTALRADPETCDSKVLLVVDESGASDPRAAAADERLATPFSPLQLQVKLRKLLGADVIGT
ncbi:MAG TPA: serine/threonine-protein kinase [Solirubrobacter sp.]|nr:serine/threonine-protein kinase [Solirubrobacter sp.]